MYIPVVDAAVNTVVKYSDCSCVLSITTSVDIREPIAIELCVHLAIRLQLLTGTNFSKFLILKLVHRLLLVIFQNT